MRATEEVVVALEDAALNLQSMLASRFVKPFADEARRREALPSFADALRLSLCCFLLC